MLAPMRHRLRVALALAMLAVHCSGAAQQTCPWDVQPVDGADGAPSQLLAITYTGPDARKKVFYGLALEGAGNEHIEDAEQLAQLPVLPLQRPSREGAPKRLRRTSRFTQVYEVPRAAGQHYALFLIASSTSIPALETLDARLRFQAMRGGTDFFGRAPAEHAMCQFVVE